MNTKRHFIAEFKAKIVWQILAEAQTINQLAAEHGRHPNQLYRGRELALAGYPPPNPPPSGDAGPVAAMPAQVGGEAAGGPPVRVSTISGCWVAVRGCRHPACLVPSARPGAEGKGQIGPGGAGVPPFPRPAR